MENKIAFLISGKKIYEFIKKYLQDENVLVVETSLSNSLEEAKKLVEKGVKVILTKLAIKIKIEDSINVPVISIENNTTDYIELLKDISIRNNKIAFVDYIDYPKTLISLAGIISKDIIFKRFSSEEECEKIILELKEKKYEVLIGNVLTKKYAVKYNLEFYEVAISEDSIEMYLEMARQILKSTDNQNLKRKVLLNIENMIDIYLQNEGKLEKNVLDKVQMNDVERDRLIESLKKNSFSLSKSANDLGISRTTLWRKLKKFNIKIE